MHHVGVVFFVCVNTDQHLPVGFFFVKETDQEEKKLVLLLFHKGYSKRHVQVLSSGRFSVKPVGLCALTFTSDGTSSA